MSIDAHVIRRLEERLTQLEDVEAIERLMSRYGECVDNAYDLAGLEELLTPDLEWESNAFGAYRNREDYLAGQAKIGKGVAWAFHVMVPIRVEVAKDGTAGGTFYLLMLGTFIDANNGSNVPIVLSARYDNEFVKQDGQWRCRRMNVNFHQVSRWSEGWVRERFWSS